MSEKQDSIPPSKDSLLEALKLSEEIVKQIELNELPLNQIALKTTRLARLLNDFTMQKVFKYESQGYPSVPDGVPFDIFVLAKKAERGFKFKDAKTGEITDLVYLESIGALEEKIEASKLALGNVRDQDITLSSKSTLNPILPLPKSIERDALRKEITDASNRLNSRRTFIYNYALSHYYDLKFSGISEDIFIRARQRIDQAIGQVVPESVQKLSAIYENLLSENEEDWSNAVHGCRRLIKALADALFPATENEIVEEGVKKKEIKLGKENYINRLIAYVDKKSESERFKEIVGSHLRYLGDRLDSINSAASKGSHTTIVSREEADRYVILTYLMVGDILSI